ncbi:hypothetical protein ACXLRS_001185 [Citrobacter youngae]
MKKETHSNEILRIKRHKKHLKKSKSLKRRDRRYKLLKKLTKIKKFNGVAIINSFISQEINSANCKDKHLEKKEKVKISLPSNFDIFSNTEDVIKKIIRVSEKILSPGLNDIIIDHRNVIKSSLSSESLFGLLLTEVVSNRRKQLNERISVRGFFPKKHGAVKSIVEKIGIVRELINDDPFSDADENNHDSNVHYFRYDNRYSQSVSIKDDKKRKVAEGCVAYLETCMNAHRLTIKKEAQDRLRACLGEVFDNAEEHCGRTRPVWFVRGYFNEIENESDRYLELSVFNLGNSISENFSSLPEKSQIKNITNTYVQRHLSSSKENALYTVAALQGQVSTKKDLDPTRGQGTVTLIETFESIYQAYTNLRAPGENRVKAQMNLISGDTVIVFDGTYQSKVVELEDGSETFQMPFNTNQTLQSPPDTKKVYTMKDAWFPGVMISIRIPLQGSTEPLRGDSNE